MRCKTCSRPMVDKVTWFGRKVIDREKVCVNPACKKSAYYQKRQKGGG